MTNTASNHDINFGSSSVLTSIDDSSYHEALKYLLTLPKLSTLIRLVERLISIFQHFKCNNVAAWKIVRRLISSIVILGKPKHGVFPRIIRKKLLFPSKQTSTFENFLYESQRFFIRYTFINSLQYTIVGDCLESTLDDFDEKMHGAINELMVYASVKIKGADKLVLDPPIEFKGLVKSNIKDIVLKSISNLSYLQEFALESGIEIFQSGEPTSDDDSTVEKKPFRVLPTDAESVYNDAILEIISGNVYGKYSTKFVELVVDIFDFSECLRAMQIEATAALQFNSHAVIAQRALRQFWAKDVGRFDGVSVNKFCALLRASLLKSTQDIGHVDGLITNCLKCFTSPDGYLFKLLTQRCDTVEDAVTADLLVGDYIVDAVDIDALSRCLDPDEEDLEISISHLLSLGSLNYCYLPPSPPVAASDYATLMKQVSFDKIEFVGVSGPITQGGHYAWRNPTHPLPVFINDELEYSLQSMLFCNQGGLVEISGLKGSGKSTLLRYIANKYTCQRSSISTTSGEHMGSTDGLRQVYWIEFSGITTVSQAMSRVIMQLGLCQVHVGDGLSTFIQNLRSFFRYKQLKWPSVSHVFIFDNIDTTSMRQQRLRRIPSKSQPLMLFVWTLFDLCKEMQDGGNLRFVFVGTTPISRCTVVELSTISSSVSHGHVSGPSLMTFTEIYQFPTPSQSILIDMATVLCPIDPQSLLISSLEVPEYMVTLSMFCSLATIREIASYVVNTVMANTVFGFPHQSECDGPDEVTNPEASTLIALSSLSANDRLEIYSKYRHYVMTSTIQDFLGALSSDEKLLAACLSAQLNLFQAILPATIANGSLNYATFYPFDAEMAWSVTKSEFGLDLSRWWLAWQGLLRNGWLFHVPTLGYFIRNPPWYLDFFGNIPCASVHEDAFVDQTIDQSGRCALGPYVYYNWAEEFSPALELEVVERLWMNYLRHWCKFVDDLYLPTIYHTKAVRHLDRHFIHIEHLVRIFTEEYIALFKGEGMEEFIPTEGSIGEQAPGNQSVEESRHSIALRMILRVGRTLAGKFSAVLDHLFTPALAIEITGTVCKLLGRYPDRLCTVSHGIAILLMGELDLIRQTMRSGAISLASETLLRMEKKYTINTLQYFALNQAPSMSPVADPVETSTRPVVLQQFAADRNKDIGVPSHIIAQVLSLRGKILRLQGHVAEAGVLFAHSIVWWQRASGSSLISDPVPSSPTSASTSISLGTNKPQLASSQSMDASPITEMPSESVRISLSRQGSRLRSGSHAGSAISSGLADKPVAASKKGILGWISFHRVLSTSSPESNLGEQSSQYESSQISGSPKPVEMAVVAREAELQQNSTSMRASDKESFADGFVGSGNYVDSSPVVPRDESSVQQLDNSLYFTATQSTVVPSAQKYQEVDKSSLGYNALDESKGEKRWVASKRSASLKRNVSKTEQVPIASPPVVSASCTCIVS